MFTVVGPTYTVEIPAINGPTDDEIMEKLSNMTGKELNAICAAENIKKGNRDFYVLCQD